MERVPINTLVLGSSYGLLPGVKLALAGNRVTFVGRKAEIAEMVKGDVEVIIPMRRSGSKIILRVATGPVPSPGVVTFSTPEAVDPSAYDFVILAMQEPQFTDPEVARLLARIARSGRPCLSIMNLPPPPFLRRLKGISRAALAGVYHDPEIWDGFNPAKMSLASPDPQAVRLDPSRPGSLTVKLPSNFKAASLDDGEDQALLERLATDMTRLKVMHQGNEIRPPVFLLAQRSLTVPLAKWPMLIAGNCRCLGPQGPRSIAEALFSDLEASRKIYAQVSELTVRLGAAPQELVPFASYAKAATGLKLPSSLARALAAGATAVERIDILVFNLMQAYGIDAVDVAAVVKTVDEAIAHNREMI